MKRDGTASGLVSAGKNTDAMDVFTVDYKISSSKVRCG